jgi:branched-chain amino acid aminotransferase
MIGAFFPGIKAVQTTISIFFKVSANNSSCFFLNSSETSFAYPLSVSNTKRLFKSAEIVGIKIPYSEDEINKAKDELNSKMALSDCYVRPIAWRGSQQMGLSTSNADINVAIAVWDDWASYFKIEDRKAGLKLITSPWKRPAPDTAPHQAKASGPYIICTMSKEVAEKKRLS